MDGVGRQEKVGNIGLTTVAIKLLHCTSNPYI